MNTDMLNMFLAFGYEFVSLAEGSLLKQNSTGREEAIKEGELYIDHEVGRIYCTEATRDRFVAMVGRVTETLH